MATYIRCKALSVRPLQRMQFCRNPSNLARQSPGWFPDIVSALVRSLAPVLFGVGSLSSLLGGTTAPARAQSCPTSGAAIVNCNLTVTVSTPNGTVSTDVGSGEVRVDRNRTNGKKKTKIGKEKSKVTIKDKTRQKDKSDQEESSKQKSQSKGDDKGGDRSGKR